MKIVIAPDKFKDSLTGFQFCEAVEIGLRKHFQNAEILKLPLADGGDGTIDVVRHYLNADSVRVTVNDPLFRPVNATYLYAENTKTAYIEMAEASGLKLLKENERDCTRTTTLGTGELIVNAIDRGASEIILGIGGSATNDAGMGMATVLGYRFLDRDNKVLRPIGANLSKVKTIDSSTINKKLNSVTVKIACDVTNPLYGKNGAAYVYAAQKGASQDDVKMLDDGLIAFAKALKTTFNINSQEIEGAGAAGGMGIASVVFLNGQLQSGIELIQDLADFDSKIANADWIITGEGKLDNQTLSGKAIQGVIVSAKAKHIKLAAFCGAISLSTEEIEKLGITYTYAVIKKAQNLEDAMENATTYLTEIASDFAQKVNNR
jgi:glycerate kinase